MCVRAGEMITTRVYKEAPKYVANMSDDSANGK